jgi:hypothetical protein
MTGGWEEDGGRGNPPRYSHEGGPVCTHILILLPKRWDPDGFDVPVDHGTACNDFHAMISPIRKGFIRCRALFHQSLHFLSTGIICRISNNGHIETPPVTTYSQSASVQPGNMHGQVSSRRRHGRELVHECGGPGAGFPPCMTVMVEVEMMPFGMPTDEAR